jgi:hypothetical protein
MSLTAQKKALIGNKWGVESNASSSTGPSDTGVNYKNTFRLIPPSYIKPMGITFLSFVSNGTFTFFLCLAAFQLSISGVTDPLTKAITLAACTVTLAASLWTWGAHHGDLFASLTEIMIGLENYQKGLTAIAGQIFGAFSAFLITWLLNNKKGPDVTVSPPPDLNEFGYFRVFLGYMILKLFYLIVTLKPKISWRLYQEEMYYLKEKEKENVDSTLGNPYSSIVYQRLSSQFAVWGSIYGVGLSTLVIQILESVFTGYTITNIYFWLNHIMDADYAVTTDYTLTMQFVIFFFAYFAAFIVAWAYFALHLNWYRNRITASVAKSCDAEEPLYNYARW